MPNPTLLDQQRQLLRAFRHARDQRQDVEQSARDRLRAELQQADEDLDRNERQAKQTRAQVEAQATERHRTERTAADAELATVRQETDARFQRVEAETTARYQAERQSADEALAEVQRQTKGRWTTQQADTSAVLEAKRREIGAEWEGRRAQAAGLLENAEKAIEYPRLALVAVKRGHLLPERAPDRDVALDERERLDPAPALANSSEAVKQAARAVESAAEELARWRVKRNWRIGAAAVAVVVVALLAGYFYVQWYNEQQRRVNAAFVALLAPTWTAEVQATQKAIAQATTDAQATLDAQAVATATAQAQATQWAHATVAVQVQATANAQATLDAQVQATVLANATAAAMHEATAQARTTATKIAQTTATVRARATSSARTTATAKAKATLVVQNRATVNNAQLNLRDGPGTGYRILGTYPRGTQVEVKGKTAEGDWFYVVAPDGRATGWMARRFLDYSGDIAKLVVSFSGRMLSVRGDRDWQSTEINVQQNQLVIVTYVSGGWAAWGTGLGPPFDSGRSGGGIIPSVSWGHLIGRIGNGQPFAIGQDLSLSSPSSGVLYLRINDPDVRDNSGVIQVRVEVR